VNVTKSNATTPK